MLDIKTLYDTEHKYTNITICGWIRRVRIGGNDSIVFIDLYDGTSVNTLPCIATENDYLPSMDNNNVLTFDQLKTASYLSPGCSVQIDSNLVPSPGNVTQKFELQVLCLRVIGNVQDVKTYPIQKSTEKQVQTLRQLPMYRMRSTIMQTVFRICSKLELGIHRFMDDNNVQKFDPNIITVSDCEGAGDTFKLSPSIFSKDKDGKDIPISLTVSSQLPLEAGITGFRNVYTMQKSFRAEKSDTKKHLAEFVHLEYESAFITFDNLLDFTERFVKYLINYIYEKCADDFNFIDSKLAPNDIKSSRKLLTELVKPNVPFTRIKYTDAIDLIIHLVKIKYMLPDEDGKMKRVKISKMPVHGQDIGAEHENLLVKYFGWLHWQKEGLTGEFGAFVFITHWPIAIKSFYMKQCDGTDYCESFDLLAPRVGEMFGGSMREWRYDNLMDQVVKRQMDPTPIQWYIDLRKNGSMPHGGWGMGFARLCMLLTGTPTVRDVVPFPVYYTHCPY